MGFGFHEIKDSATISHNNKVIGGTHETFLKDPLGFLFNMIIGIEKRNQLFFVITQ